jgi:Fur family ferric uptake transcriptional regulator
VKYDGGMKKDRRTLLKSLRLKATPARLAMLDVFALSSKPINAEHISERLKGLKVDHVTVYRTLASFEEKGIIKQVDLRKGSVYYELQEGEHHHHHLVCTDCGKVEDFDACEVGAALPGILKKSSFKAVDSHSLELFGLCRKCFAS